MEKRAKHAAKAAKHGSGSGSKKRGFVGRLLRFVFFRLMPVAATLFAVLVGYVLAHPLPMGRFFWLVRSCTRLA